MTADRSHVQDNQRSHVQDDRQRSHMQDDHQEVSASHLVRGKLVICPTPLGNLDDITLRALDVLRGADVVCAEDTRVTGKLLAAFDIKKPLHRLDENMLSKGALQIIDRVLEGETVVYCSDAGMPGVSDPGYRLIADAYDRGAPVEVLPGASAVTTAYVASGFAALHFYFGGFFPRKEGERRAVLNDLANLDASLIFYESPRRLASALQIIAEVFPQRDVAVCRELTKLHEEVFRASSKDVWEKFSTREKKKGIKGEIVIVIDAPSPEEKEGKKEDALGAAREYAVALKQEAEWSNKDHSATDITAKDLTALLQEKFSLSRNDAYEIALSTTRDL